MLNPFSAKNISNWGKKKDFWEPIFKKKKLDIFFSLFVNSNIASEPEFILLRRGKELKGSDSKLIFASLMDEVW